MSLVARHLEANGIPTVVMGCAKDIVERVGVPRFLFSDFPLGNAAGRPGDVASQQLTLDLALALLERAPGLREVTDLNGHTLLHVLGNNEGWARWLECVGEPDIDVDTGVQFDTSAVALEYAAAGGGVAIGASSLTRDMMRNRRLVAPFPVKVPANEAFYLVSPESRTDSENSAKLRAWLLEEAEADISLDDTEEDAKHETKPVLA